METGARKKFLVGGLLAGSAAVTLFAVVFFTLGPLVFGDPSGGSGEERRYAQKFEQILEFVSRNYVDEVDQQKLFDGAMKGLFESLGDPYSLYLSSAEMMSLTDTTTGEFGGVGLYINKLDPSAAEKTPEPQDAWVEVVAPIEDTPAWKAGILAGDWITKIEGDDAGPLTMDEVLKRLRGQPGTDVRIEVLRGASTTLEFTLKREIIQVPSVKSTWIDDIAYLRITQFTAHTPEAFDAAVATFTAQGFTRLIIDLRNNPGGLLDAVARVGGRFFHDGVIVSTRSRVAGESSVFEARGDQTIPDNVQIIVLIDKGSASAAEILSGALKDRKRAWLLGETTYGKGSVQQVIPFDKTGFKLTMARYYTPSGTNIDKVGIAPHQEFKERELTEAELTEYGKLLEEKTFATFAEAQPTADASAVATFVRTLKARGVGLEARLLARLTRLELDRVNNRTGSVVDLEFDTTLQEAVRVLRAGIPTIP